VRVDVRGVEAMDRLPAPVETALFRVLQEVLRNVEQHARARLVVVRLTRGGGPYVALTVEDDGVGFATEGSVRRTPARHLGLLGMRERVNHVGGTFKITSARGRGTQVEARIPLLVNEGAPPPSIAKRKSTS
jgi:signal transduction histidine kinase